MPDSPWIPTDWEGTLPGAIPVKGHFAEVSTPPQETASRRQGEGRKGPVREQGEGWVYAPATSHISRFKLYDVSSFAGFIVSSPESFTAQNRPVTIPEGLPSQLHVVFKGPPKEKGGIGVGEVAEYVYYFSDHDAGRSIYDAMRSSAHPYGTVLTPKVIKTGIPYHPLARS